MVKLNYKLSLIEVYCVKSPAKTGLSLAEFHMSLL